MKPELGLEERTDTGKDENIQRYEIVWAKGKKQGIKQISLAVLMSVMKEK